MEVPNRIVMSPMVTNYGDDKGYVTDQTVAYYTARARGGVGWIMVESAFIHRAGLVMPHQLGLDDDKYIKGFGRLTKKIKREGSRVSLQIHHAGRRAMSDVSGLAAEGPSSIPLFQGAPVPRELTLEDIENRVEAFVQTARRAKEAGFDGVDVHGGHGYLISSFLSKFANQRTDQFGGDLENRARLALEVVRRIRKHLGKEFVVTVRINASDFTPGGLTYEEAKVVAQWLEKEGVNAIHVSAGGGGLLIRDITELIKAKEEKGSRSLKEAGLKLHDLIEFDLDQPMTFLRLLPMGVPRACYASLSRGIKESVKIPVLVVGRINRPEVAEEILRRGDADLTVIGRGLLADPEFPKKARRGDLAGIRHCIGCNYGCFHNLGNRRPVLCTTNPFTGREATLKMAPALSKKRVMVVGAGPGGLEAAVIAAKRGHEVTLYERERKIGGQLNVAFVPPDRDEIRNLLPYYEEQLKQTGVRVVVGKEVRQEEVKNEKPDVLIIATGALPMSLGKGSEPSYVVQAVDLLSGKAKARGKVLIVGGGAVGCETADFLAKKGFSVTLVEMLDKIATDAEPDDRNFLFQKMIDYDVDVRLNTKVKEIIRGKGAAASTPRGEETIQADTVVLAIGLQSNRALIDALSIKDNNIFIDGKETEIYLVGDCKEPRKILEAIHEGAEAGLKI